MTDLITVILDEGGPDKKFVDRGYCLIAPNKRFPDGSDGMIIGRITAKGLFSRDSPPSVMLLPCDLVGPQRSDGTPDWHYEIKYSNDFPGKPRPWSFQLLSTGGSTQHLRDLLPVLAAQPSQPNPVPWNEEIAQGSFVQREFTFTAPDGTPLDVEGTVWEYILRDKTGAQVFTFRTTPTIDGSLSVTSTEAATKVTFSLLPAATTSLAPGMYQQALWMNPDDETAYAWLAGELTINLVAQP